MRFFKKADAVIIIVLILSGLTFRYAYDSLIGDQPAKAEIYYYSELVKTVSLDGKKEKDFSIEQNPNVIFRVDREGNIGFIASDCPDKICVKTGKLHRVGEYAACLPNGIILKIVPGGERDDDDPDIIIGN